MMKKSLMFLLLSLVLIAPAFATVSFLDGIQNLSVNEGESLIHNITVNTTNLNGSLNCLIKLTPEPNGSYSFESQSVGNLTNCTFYFTPTFDDAGPYSVNFTVSDNDNSSTLSDVTLTVNDVNRVPEITSPPVTTVYVGQTYTYDVNAIDADDDTLVYWLDSAPAGMTIDDQTGLITWLPTEVGTYSIVVNVTDGTNTTTQEYTLTVNKKVYLSFERVKVEVNGDSETLSDEEKFEVEPGSSVDFSFKIENVHPDKLDIENVYVEVYIREIDSEDEDDLYEESDEVDLDYGDYETLDVSFDIPLLVEDDKYDVDVYVYGTDESNLDIMEEKHYTLEVEKDRYNIYLKNFEIFPEKITCTGSAELVGRIYNIGRNDLDLRITVTNDELGLNYQKTVTLDSDPFDEDNDFLLNVPISIDSAKETKDYNLMLKVTDEDDKINLVRFFKLSVVKCEEKEETEEDKGTEDESQDSEVEVDVGTTEPVTPQQPEQSTEIIYEQPFTETPLFIAMLFGGFLLLLVLILVLIILLFRK